MEPQTAPSATSHRYSALDGLRGVAATLVVLFHIAWPNHVTHNAFVRHGYLAVDLFFILSGFVISAGYSAKIADARGVGRFLVLRFFRIYPLHAAVLTALVGFEALKLAAAHYGWLVPGHAAFTGRNTVGALIANLLLVHGLGALPSLSWNVPSWSISCEFAAYVCFGLWMLAGGARKPLLFVLGSVAALASYGILIAARGTLDVTFDFGFVRCIAGFFLGMTVYEFSLRRRSEPARATTRALISAGELAILGGAIAVMSLAAGWRMVAIVPLFVLLVALLQSDRGIVARWLASPAPQFLGRISYSIYLTHDFLLTLLSIVVKRVMKVPMAYDPATLELAPKVSPWLGDALVLAALVLTLGVSALTYRFIEEPARLFGRGLVKEGARTLVEPRSGAGWQGSNLVGEI